MIPQFAPTDVVVVGGGVAGLSAACYLGQAGVAVTLLEKASSLGGRAATRNRDGFCFNRGAHALYTGGEATAVLRELGVTYKYGIPKNVSMLLHGKLYPLPSDPITLLRGHALAFGDKLELTRLLMGLSGRATTTLARVSVQEWLEDTIRRPRVRLVVAALARTLLYSAALDRISADVFVTRLQRSLKHPIHYVEGGWQTLVDGLRQAAEQAGVRIVSGQGVTAVEHWSGRVEGVRLRDGSTLPAHAVVVATDPRDAAKLVDDGAFPSLRAIVDTLVPARIACLDVALRHLPSSRYYIVQDLERPRFLTTQSVYASIAPAGGALVSTFKQLDPARPSDPDEDERDLEDLLDVTLPGWRGALIERVYLPRIEAVGALPTVTSGGLAGRPGSRVPGLANLYLAGDWIGSEGFLVDASMASARQAARFLLADEVLSVNRREVVGPIRSS